MKRKRLMSMMISLFLILSTMFLTGFAQDQILPSEDTIFTEDFQEATTGNVFTASYRSIPNDSSKPMYIRKGGTITVEDELLVLGPSSGGRLTIGALSDTNTTSSSTPGGVLDLSQPYKIIIKIAEVGRDTGKNFQVYVDNNTTSQGNSIHGGSSKVFQQKLSELELGELTIQPTVGTQTSFIQLRTESGGNIKIDEVIIQRLVEIQDPEEPPYPEDPEDPVDPERPTDPENPIDLPEGIFALTGYATLNGGTTGGFVPANGEEPVIVTATTGEELEGFLKYKRDAKKYQDRGTINKETGEVWVDPPMIIYIDGPVTHDNSRSSKIDVKEVENLSIIGVADRGEFDGIGITISRANNIIIRNLSIHHVRGGSSTAIEITESSHNIWIDHNDFYSELDVGKDYYDGLVDIKRNAEYITVSWNRFYNHNKTMLVGHTDNEGLKPDKITYHHNYFFNLNSRVPLIRYAEVHMFNNYSKDIVDTGINARVGAKVRVENNYFDNVGAGTIDSATGQRKGPLGWFYGSPSTGYWHVSGNVFINCPVSEYESTTTMNIPYNYSSVLHSAEEARDLVLQYAGVGVIDGLEPPAIE